MAPSPRIEGVNDECRLRGVKSKRIKKKSALVGLQLLKNLILITSSLTGLNVLKIILSATQKIALKIT